MKLKASWLRHILLLKECLRSEVWVLIGPQGSGKTSTARGMKDAMIEAGLKVTENLESGFDVWYLDDGGRYFSKRFWQSKASKELSRFLQVVRGLFTLVLVTVPDIEMLDISLRESGIVEIISTVSPGLAIWREPIVVVPRWQDESWREKYVKQLAELLQEK